ncbi:hypothetical protein KBC04_02030 [Candidatus Babeliales bacterium]|nr:hypothetical protein [Candidatus Babeliales bacterium]MBP9843812.1 hypothetical protein [Candidatus Babeliales bacterium]
MLKKFIIILSLLSCIAETKTISTAVANTIQGASSLQGPARDLTQPQLYNRSTLPVNVYMYTGAVTVNGSRYTIDENSLINSIGIIIPAGGSINWLPNVRSISVFYESKDPIITNIQPGNSFIITPSADKWTVTQKVKTP